ncbi:MAG TPA: PilN domain-containing protein [Tissierellia bacterium]|jgi:type IV pilus assembly protein PilN|nr:PilN domain-containing protein [Tissierellia bacterium]
MVDLNFFEPYIERREFRFNRMVLLYILLALCLVGVAAIGIYNQVQLSMLQGEVEARRALAEEPGLVSKYEEIKELENEMETFKREVENIIKMDKNIAKSDIISEELLNEIRSKMPEDLFLTNLSASGRDVRINGATKDSNSVAEFSKGLRFIKDVESVFIDSIDKLEDNYNFVLNIVFKDVNIDEQSQE